MRKPLLGVAIGAAFGGLIHYLISFVIAVVSGKFTIPESEINNLTLHTQRILAKR